ncbi:MAG: recombination protein RecR [Calditrichaeota bacterium]|nr:recombination protein RecR [Calditrichota bacterium]
MNDSNTQSGLPPSVITLSERLAGFPGVGRKSALRMAMHILRSPKEFTGSLCDALMAVKEKVSFCHTCWTLSEEDPCPICSDTRRDHSAICVVEEPGDVIAIERTNGWHGIYHVLGGAIAPLDGIGPDQIRLDALYKRIEESGNVQEVVVATNPTSEGETTALYIARMCKPLNVKVTRIARGIPVGSDLEFVDDSTLQQSFNGRAEI